MSSFTNGLVQAGRRQTPSVFVDQKRHNYKPKELFNEKTVCLGPSPMLKAWF